MMKRGIFFFIVFFTLLVTGSNRTLNKLGKTFVNIGKEAFNQYRSNSRNFNTNPVKPVNHLQEKDKKFSTPTFIPPTVHYKNPAIPYHPSPAPAQKPQTINSKQTPKYTSYKNISSALTTLCKSTRLLRSVKS